MTLVRPDHLWSETRSAEDVRCGIESGAEVVYADDREAEEAADRRHDHSDHLGPLFYTGEPGAMSYNPICESCNARPKMDGCGICEECWHAPVEIRPTLPAAFDDVAWRWYLGMDR